MIKGFAVPVKATVPTTGTLHLGETNPFTGGLREHVSEVINYALPK